VDAVPGLLVALGDPDENVRGRAVGALEVVGRPEAIEALLALLERDEAAWVRHGALQALARLGAEEVLAPAEALLEDPDARTRAAGARALGALASVRGLPALDRALTDGSPWVRRTAVISVLLVGSPEGRPLLARAVADDDWEVRLYAAEALKRLGPS
jgi:HEAT repeat protein